MPVVTRLIGPDEYLVDFNESQFTISKNKVPVGPYVVDADLLKDVPMEHRPHRVLLLANIAIELNHRLK
ncbi:MAG: hypothetical protein SHS37scaffold220_11 [Phage 67_12]|nr:MAG: hypothetical protein SHS37scaffold220_11 [Phage 67_12]